MKPFSSSRAWSAGILIAALALSLVAPAAQADRGGHHRYKSDDGGRWRHAAAFRSHGSGRVIEVHRSSSAVPAIAGFLGGLVIGAALSHDAHPAVAYEDPYTRERFDSFDQCSAHQRYQRHPRVVRVIVVSTGECERTYACERGRWVDVGNDWNGDDEE